MPSPIMEHGFSRAPTADIPRSSFNRSSRHLTAFDAGFLVPIYWDEALPGDTFIMNANIFARMATPIYPLMDNLYMDVHWFGIPIRQVWDNFRKFMGEQANPDDSTDYLIPTYKAPATTGFDTGGLADYFGLPTKVPDYEFNALLFRCYWHTYNEWYRDQNLIDSFAFVTGDMSASTIGQSGLLKRGKRHDYFTSALPWLQKGDAVQMPLGSRADVKGIGIAVTPTPGGAAMTQIYPTGETGTPSQTGWKITDSLTPSGGQAQLGVWQGTGLHPDIYADLSTATAATINQIREAFQVQKLLERDARSGTRYSEIVNAHFGVHFLDVTYRPEFLGGGTFPINVHTVPQTSESATTPQGNLSAFATVTGRSSFSKSFTEHCYILGIASVRQDQLYQHGLNRAWSRQTRYDFYWPSLAHIGEQAILTQELYCQDPTVDTGPTGTPDNQKVFGYQERWAEYRYKPSMVTGIMRSNATASLHAWHLAQELSALPTLGQTFIQEAPPMNRVLAVPSQPDFIVDAYFNLNCVRPMPLFSVPGLTDHF